MEIIMKEGIILTVNVKGALKTPNFHQVGNSIDHDCCIKTVISADVIDFWQSSHCPYWEKAFVWKHMNKKDRFKSYLKRFDEGYGVSFEEL